MSDRDATLMHMVQHAPLMEFPSHIRGKNADVAIFADRIEWILKTSKSATAALVTGGASLLVPRRQKGREMIAMRAISSVVTRRDGLINSWVSVVAGGNTIDFRVPHARAAEVAELMNHLIVTGGQPPAGYGQPAPATPVVHQTPAQPPPQHAPTAEPPATSDVGAELTRLADLRDRGVLTDDEFAEQKRRLLGGPQQPAPTGPAGPAPTVAPQAPAGWHPDPTGRNQLRWYDGQRWTNDVHNDGHTANDPL